MINFHVSHAELGILDKIANRVERELPDYPDDRRTLLMDLSAARNSVNLNLGRLLSFSDFDFAHDIYGIRHHINRATGKLEGCFLPRSSDL